MSDEKTWLTVSSSALTARIDPLGAQLSTLRDAVGRELLWDGDPAFWSGRAPVLFPIVGTLAGGTYRLGDETYALGRHGFARGRQFEVLDATPAAATLRLRADAHTLAVYPFRFALQARFAVSGSTLSVTFSVSNEGDGAMPASLGYHPAFRWPLPFHEAATPHDILFDVEEPEPIRRIDAAGLLTSVRHPTPIAGRRLLLTHELFSNDAMILDAVRSRGVSYGAPTGPRIAVRFADTPYLGLWSKPGAPFICIEPWHGLSDPEGFSGELTEKPGIFVLAPGARRDFRIEITLTGGPTR